MGRTFLDIDMVRAADLLGMERRQAEQIRDLDRGHFLGLGPAVSRRPVAVKVGSVRTAARSVASGLMRPPTSSELDMEALFRAEKVDPAQAPPVEAPPPITSPDDLQEQIESQMRADVPGEPVEPEDTSELIQQILRDMAAEEDSTFQPIAALFQDFSVRCRMHGIRTPGVDALQFRRRFAAAVAGLDEVPDEEQTALILRLSRTVPEELLAPFLAIAKAAALGEHCPDDHELARIYGTNSLGRVRRMIENLEKCGAIVVRTDFGGRRTVTIPAINLTTLAA